MSEELKAALARIACLEGEIAKRDEELAACRVAVENCEVFRARVVELEAVGIANEKLTQRIKELKSELSALKAQEPVQVDYVAVMRADGDGDLEVEWLLEGGTAELMNGMYLCCVGGGTLLFEGGSGQLYAAPVPEAKAQGEYGDAYQGAREDLAIWKRRALEAEKALQEERIITERLGNALNEENGPTFMGEPVFPAKANTVVMPEPMKRGDEGGSGEYGAAMIRGYNACLREVARLNAAPVQRPKCKTCDDNGRIGGPSFYAPDEGGYPCPDCCAPVQQVSVPDASTDFSQFLSAVMDAAGLVRHGRRSKELSEYLGSKCMEYRCFAAPAAPAADAGIVDMYRHLQKVTPYRFKKIQDASITDGGDVMYFHKDRFDAALLADMAAHCAAKGVV